jgi:putative alpha-1,2-mannosidase
MTTRRQLLAGAAMTAVAATSRWSLAEAAGEGGDFDPCAYVDPFIGTGAHGHTFPGATLPFGMVQLSPDTDNARWDACSGYHHDDKTLLGFSHTHLSGTPARSSIRRTATAPASTTTASAPRPAIIACC